MSVICKQVVDGEPQTPYVIEPHYDGQTDEELLLAKFNGASDKDWNAEWTSETSFVARKIRWQNNLCERFFFIEG